MSEEATYRLDVSVWPKDGRQVMVVGCGGTGSFVVDGLCRLLAPEISLLLVDDDRVEERNLLRQNFCANDLGKFKSQALAERLAIKFGRRVGYSTTTFTPDLIKATNNWHGGLYQVIYTVVVGCVDNGPARAAIARAMLPWSGKRWWIDAGNADNWGQVLIGNNETEHMEGAFNQARGICYSLPLPSIQQPEILAGRPQPANSCAEAVANNHQSELINQTMSVLVLEVVRRLLAGTLSWMQIWLDLENFTMRTVGATPETVARMTGMEIRQLVK
jgi:PRTRC genetic system ThiF family protein